MKHELEESGAEFLYSYARVERDEFHHWTRPDRPIGADETVAQYLFLNNQFIQTSTIVVSTELAKRIRFDGALLRSQDYDFCVRLYEAGARPKMIEQSLIVWRDYAPDYNRVSHGSGYEDLEVWIESMRNVIGDRCVSAYKANVLAYYVARSDKLKAARYMFSGLVAGVKPSLIARQALRSFFSTSFYRSITNLYIDVMGRLR